MTDPTLKNSGPKPMSMNRNSGNNEGNSDGSNSDESGNSNPVTTTESSGTLHERVFFHVLMALVRFEDYILLYFYETLFACSGMLLFCDGFDLLE